MALGRSRSFAEYDQKYSKRFSRLPDICSQDDGLELIGCMRRIGGKRILVPNRPDILPIDCLCDSRPLKRLNSKLAMDSVSGEKSLNLGALPLDILVRILCGVEHDDLNQLYLVSKTIRKAALIAKEHHFAFSTPKSKRHRTRDNQSASLDFLGNSAELDDIEAPNAPLRHRYGKTKGGKKFAEISVNLFQSATEN